MYEWRNLSPNQRADLLRERLELERPWHHPPKPGGEAFHVTAACYEHRPWIGRDPGRMTAFARGLLSCVGNADAGIHAWCVLPNHYHILLSTRDAATLKRSLGRLHGRSSHEWNVEEARPGRKCFHGCLFKPIKSPRHRKSTVNYIHHNPVRHGIVKKWTDWPWSSVHAYLARNGRDAMKEEWDLFPITGMGDGWDE